jgi:FemAB-related protein (PEP-CTERM system-associated)
MSAALDVMTTGSADMQVHSLDAARAGDWDDFVSGCAEATFFHRAGWAEVIERAFGHKTHFLFAEAGGRIQGVLPLGHVRSRLFGNALISNPFCVYGGIAAETQAAAVALQQAAQELATRLGVDYLECRNRVARNPDWDHKDLYVTFRKEMDPDPEVNMLTIPRKQRAMVRKGIKAGLVSEIDTGIDRLYAAYSESVHNLGTPVFGKGYFRILQEVFGQDCEVLTISQQGRLIGSVMSFYFRDEVLPYYGGGTAAARRVQGNDFMYWELMRRSCERGLKWFDYGRSKEGTGSYSFKKNWGFEPEPLHYEYWLVKAGAMPNVSPTNPKYRLFIDAWKHLPLPVTRLVGPWIARNLG